MPTDPTYQKVLADELAAATQDAGGSGVSDRPSSPWAELVTPETREYLAQNGLLGLLQEPAAVVRAANDLRDLSLEEMAALPSGEARAWAIIINDLYGHDDERVATLIQSCRDGSLVGELVQANLQPPMTFRKLTRPRPYWRRYADRDYGPGNLFKDFGISLNDGGHDE